MEAEARTLMVDKQSFDMLLGPLEAREKKKQFWYVHKPLAMTFDSEDCR